ADVLSADLVAEVLTAIGGVWYERVYTPLVALWVFLGQVLRPDPSCRAAVARLNAHRVARGQRPCSARTGAYCPARRPLPERPVGGCRSGWARTWPAGPGGPWTPGRTRGGSGRAGGCTCTTGPTRPCPTRRPTRPSTPSRTPRSRASGSRWRGWRPSSRWPAG